MLSTKASFLFLNSLRTPILLLGLSLASLGALSFDELIYKDEVKSSFDCSKIKYDGKSDD
ncbi:hypothetical protein VWN47_10870, partial [Campylobacter jejuni]